MRAAGLGALLALALAPATAAVAQPVPETIIQWFETDWAEITARMPELAAAGYTALWLPPPTKGAEGIVDVGFSVFDRFDLGEYDQRGTVRTKYGTLAELVAMVAEAHKYGIKVYFDIVMNHNSNPAKLENAAAMLQPARIDEYPGTSPLDYHVLPARDVGNGNWEVRNPAFYGSTVYTLGPDRGNNEQFVATTPIPMGTTIAGFTHLARAPSIDFGRNDRTQELHYSLLGLIDFALEQDVTASGPGPRDGINLVTDLPLPRYVRNADRPSTYPGGTPVAEDVREYMMRWIAWFGDVTDADGLRLDAIKHAPREFFGSDFANDPIDFNGVFQRNLDRRRGYSDGDDNDGVDDALLFGESFTGDLGSLNEYWRTGMFLLDFPLLFKLAHDGGVFARGGDGDMGQLSFPQGGMSGRYDEFGGLGRNAGVSFVQSHDTPAPRAQPNPAYAYALTRVGHSVVFYDGNNANHETFVQPGRLDALGELNSSVITDLIDIRRRFARGGQFNRYVDGDCYIYERVVPTASNSGGATLLVALTDSTTQEARFGEFDSRPLVVTEFAPGTELIELTGNGATPTVTVLDPQAVPANARNAALAAYDLASDFPVPSTYGLVYLQIPAGPERNYVAYAPRTPALTVAVTSGGQPLSTRTVTTVGARRTPAGAPVPAATITPSVLRLGARLDVRATVDALAERVYVRFDDGRVALPGLTRATGTPDGVADGWYEATADASGRVLADVDLTMLGEGLHLVTVRAVRGARPAFWSEARVLVELDDMVVAPDGGVVVPGDGGVNPGADGGVSPGADGGGPTPDAGMTSTDRDPDRDGVESERDVCPAVFDPEQRDFDTDGRGDACDACPETMAGLGVDADGCAEVSVEVRDALDAILAAILARRFDAALDQDGDGKLDAADFVLRARAGGVR